MGRHMWTLGAAVFLYCLWCLLLILQGAGLQYDEALLVLGSVHMQRSAAEIPLPHDPHTWIEILGRSLPLMTVRYVGAVKEYLFLPVFGIFGPDPYLLRAGNALLGALGIWGLGRLLAGQVGYNAAVAAAMILAINPAYAAMTVFDNGTVAVWMGVLGLVCLCLGRYLAHRTAWSAFWLGLALGLGIWARANFLWLLAAMLIAAALVWKGALFERLSHYGAMAGGMLLGGLPFLVYQIVSQGGTWEAQTMFRLSQGLKELLSQRFVLLGGALFSDGEHRAMWNGPALPDWQRWLFPAVVAVCCVVCLAIPAKPHQRRWARAVAVAFLCLAAFLFTSRLPVAEHHLIVLVPLAAAVVSIAGCLMLARYRASWPVIVALGVVYAASACYWQISAIRGLYATGGIGPWSDAVFALSDHLERKYPWREIQVLDWGLLNNLYVLSDGELRAREIYEHATAELSAARRPWTAEIARGGVFLINGPENGQFSLATAGFLKALAQVKPPVRHVVFEQRDGAVYAEIYEVDPTPAGR